MLEKYLGYSIYTNKGAIVPEEVNNESIKIVLCEFFNQSFSLFSFRGLRLLSVLQVCPAAQRHFFDGNYCSQYMRRPNNHHHIIIIGESWLATR